MKSLIEKFIQRSVLTSALSIFILMLGLFGLMKLPLRFLPKMDQALIGITTVYPGANSQVVKSFVTSKIQNAIIGVEGVDYITSTSATGVSDIKVYLLPGTNSDITSLHLMEKISSIQHEMPQEVKTPVISKQSTDNQPILILGFSSKALSRTEVADYLRRVVRPQIESVDGVSQANVWGDQYVMQIWLNPRALTAYHLSPQDVIRALKQQNVLASPGKTQGHYFNYTLNATTALHSTQEFNQLVIKVINHVPIYLKDIGEARLGGRSNDFSVYYNHEPTTMLGVLTLPSSNPLTVVADLLKKLPQIRKGLPADLSMHIVLNRTDFIRSSIHEVIKTLIESVLIVIAVIFLFLGNIRAALIPAITIPLSLIGICFFMHLFGHSINTITLLAMVLGVGLVVDDAIVVVENCVKHLNDKMTAIQSTIIASQELVIPVIAMTLTLAAVYIPIGLTGGLIGQLFNEFAFTLAGSVVISGLLALTISPMMGARLINISQQRQPFAEAVERIVAYFERLYRTLLNWVFRHKYYMVGMWVMIMILTSVLYVFTPSELAPTENQGFLLALGNAPANANLSYLEHYAFKAHQIYKQFKEIDDYATILSASDGFTGFIISRDPSKRFLNLTKPLQQALSTIPGLDFHLIAPSILASSGPPIQFVIASTEDEKHLYRLAKMIEAKAMQSGVFMYLYDDLNYSNPEANFVIDSKQAAALNVSMSDIAMTLSSLMSNQQVQQYSANDQSYDVVVKTLTPYQLNPEDLQMISVPTANGTTVPLVSVGKLNYTIAPTALHQFQKMNSVMIMGAVLPGQSISQGLSTLSKLANAHFSKNVNVDYAGTSRQFLQEGHRMLIIFSLAIMVIFLVLSMQFESYRDSLIILLGSVPMALFAALLPLKYGLGSINIYTQIGMLTLVGLISKHGILITRFANEIKAREGIDNQSAVIEAAILRLRPILMTTAAIVFGALPLVYAEGAGSASRYAMGIVISFGISLGTLFTLMLLPVIYTVFSRSTSSTNVSNLRARRDSNSRPSGSKPDTLSS